MDFPRNTDPRHTYKWRNLKRFIDKIDEWGLDERTAYRIVDAVVDYAKRRGQLKVWGLSALTSEKVLEVGIESIRQQIDKEADVLSRIAADRSRLPATELLKYLSKKEGRASPNIVVLYMRGHISRYYIAFSRACWLAINRLPAADRRLLPSVAELHRIRDTCKEDKDMIQQIRATMADDWCALC